jgi:hypothetical protein
LETLAQQAHPVVKSLLKNDEEQLFTELALREKAIQQNPALKTSLDPDVYYDVEHMGPLDDLARFGRVFFNGINRDCYGLVCGAEGENAAERQKFASALHIGPTEAAAVLTGLLVAQLSMAPAIAAVVASIVIKLFFRNALKATCDVWKGHLPAG